MRSLLAREVRPPGTGDHWQLILDFFTARKVERYPWDVKLTAVFAMGFVFPLGYYGLQHSELVFLGFSEAIFFKLMAWRRQSRRTLFQYINIYAPSEIFAERLRNMGLPADSDFDEIRRRLVWLKTQGDDLHERFSADASVRCWINKFRHKDVEEVWDTGKWATFAKKVEASHHELVEELQLVQDDRKLALQELN